MEDDSRVQATAFGKKRGGGGVLILSGRIYIKSRSHTFSTPMQKLRLHGRDARDDGGTIRTFCVNCTVLVKRLGYNTNLFASTFTFCDTSGSGCGKRCGSTGVGVGIGVGEGGVASRVRIRGGVGVRSKEEGEGMGALLEVGKAVEGIWTLAASERERGFHMS